MELINMFLLLDFILRLVNSLHNIASYFIKDSFNTTF